MFEVGKYYLTTCRPTLRAEIRGKLCKCEKVTPMGAHMIVFSADENSPLVMPTHQEGRGNRRNYWRFSQEVYEKFLVKDFVYTGNFTKQEPPVQGRSYLEFKFIP